jgi:hypothetical protein
MVTLDTAIGHAARALEYESQEHLEAATAELELALREDPTLTSARRRLIQLLVRLGAGSKSLEFWDAELRNGVQGLRWTHDAITELMKLPDLTLAGTLAGRYAAMRWGTRDFLDNSGKAAYELSEQPPESLLSVGKLEHDAAQFRYLRARNLLGRDYEAIIADYQRIVERLKSEGVTGRTEMTSEDRARIGNVYNRFVHLSDTPRVPRALGSGWDGRAVERAYLHDGPGLVVVDDFLSPQALAYVRRLCLESTLWTGNRYSDGRLGAFFMSGFSAPLLLQIAEEMRRALPSVIGRAHSLRQLWAFKNLPRVAGDSAIHADFAAVNVNFWITPDEANRDRASGGLVVYDKAAPLAWDFEQYNRRPDLIEDYLRGQQARAITIPYRQNRAIIFNSDLFHATSNIDFRPEYENRRINVTMLYGQRVDDRHHPSVRGEPPVSSPGGSSEMPAWRSGAFRHVRRG